MTPDLLLETQGNYLSRPRLHTVFTNAVEQPLTIVCAGAGYGKTYAVLEFTRTLGYPSVYTLLCEYDNASSRFWEKYIRIFTGWNEPFAEHCRLTGFPDTQDRMNLHFVMQKKYTSLHQRLIVIDNLHLITHPLILLFINRWLREYTKNVSVIVICRDLPTPDLSELQIKSLVSNVTEQDLCFTENELAQYLDKQGITIGKQSLRDIHKDTNGWAFAIHLIVRSLKNAPGYAGYVRKAMRQNIFSLMNSDIWRVISERLRRFLVCLSLIEHLSGELVEALAKEDADILFALRSLNAYIRFNRYTNAYIIHHLFLDFLRSKKDMLTKEEISETYRIAARWCAENEFEIDALTYYEKLGDFHAVTSVLSSLPVQMPVDIANYGERILKRAPDKTAETVDLFAAMHIYMLIRLGRFEEATAQAQAYEKKILSLPVDDLFRDRALGTIYYAWGNLRDLMGTQDGRLDFDVYYEKAGAYLSKAHVKANQYTDMPVGFWASLTGSSHPGAPQEYIQTAARAVSHVCGQWHGAMAGLDLLCQGELCFYQEDMKSAEQILINALRQARKHNQSSIEQKTLFYLMRLALWQGNRPKAEQILAEMEARSKEDFSSRCFFHCDAALGFYYSVLRDAEEVPSWLKKIFSPYYHVYFIENIDNQIKARYHYLKKDYPPLLTYIEEMKQRESVLYGRIEMLALEACTHLQMGNKAAALASLREAYAEAAPNSIIIPFAELGKDMRTLIAAAQRNPDSELPAAWLETVKRKSASFAKRQSQMVLDYKKSRGYNRKATLSTREAEILSDLYHGLSRPEISVKQTLSINTVNSVIVNIFNKLGAHSIADAVRIAAEEKLV